MLDDLRAHAAGDFDGGVLAEGVDDMDVVGERGDGGECVPREKASWRIWMQSLSERASTMCRPEASPSRWDVISTVRAGLVL
jgi:hypothetical protein